MATERDFELLDDYLANRLKGSEKTSFEQQMQADPELQNELKFQERLLKGITEARKAELKAMLQNIPVPPVNYGTSALGKLAIGTVVAGLVATGIYLYTDKEETSPSKETGTTITPQDSSVQQETIASAPSESEKITAAEESLAENKTDEAKPEAADKKKKQSKPQSATEQPVIDVYEPVEEGQEEISEEVEEPAGERTSPVKAAAPSIAVEIDKDNKKYNFHYQFKDGKLHLYGPFERNLYEILEFFSEDERTVFLYYKDGYYLLEENNEKVKSLKLIEDAALIQKLKDYRQE